jgi:hypothetical protein
MIMMINGGLELDAFKQSSKCFALIIHKNAKVAIEKKIELSPP